MHYLLTTAITIFLWSTLAVLVAKLTHLPAFFILAVSLFIGGCLSIRHYKHWYINGKLLLVGVTGIFGYHFLLFIAFRLAPPMSANLLNYLWPLLILLFSPLFFKGYSLQSRHIVGMIVSFAGASLLMLSNGFSLSSEHLLGNLLAIGAAFTWACYSLLSKKFGSVSSSTVGLFCLISSLLSLIAHLGLEQTPEVSMNDMVLLLMLGIGPLGIAFYCWDSALKKGDPRIIATLAYLTPLLSTLMLVVFGNEKVSANLFMAMILIVGGALIANFRFDRALKAIKMK